MNKGLLVLILSFFADSCLAAIFSEDSFDLLSPAVVTLGSTIEEAKNKAEKSIPKGFEVAYEQNSPVIECESETIYWNEQSQCGSSQVRYTLPIRKVKR